MIHFNVVSIGHLKKVNCAQDQKTVCLAGKEISTYQITKFQCPTNKFPLYKYSICIFLHILTNHSITVLVHLAHLALL